MKILKESSTSRIYQHLSDESSCAIISAFRGDNSLEKNEELFRSLKKDVRNLGLGFIEFVSRWVEDGESFDEKSILIPDIKFKDAFKLGEVYKQSSIIFKDAEGCKEYCTTPFESYQKGDTVRVFNNVGPNMLNLEDAKDIFAKRKGGPASAPIKGGKPFNLQVVEKLAPAPSTFRSPSEFTILEVKGD